MSFWQRLRDGLDAGVANERWEERVAQTDFSGMSDKEFRRWHSDANPANDLTSEGNKKIIAEAKRRGFTIEEPIAVPQDSAPKAKATRMDQLRAKKWHLIIGGGALAAIMTLQAIGVI